MGGGSVRLLAIVASVAAALIPGDASARTIRRSCRDGLIAHRTDDAGRTNVACDVDGQCDNVCAFEVPLCGASACEATTLTVPVGSTRRERAALSPGAAPTQLVLRCRPTPRIVHCVTVTTTTSASSTTRPAHLPGPGATTTTSLPLGVPAAPTSTSTTRTIPTITTTTTLAVPCRKDADCNGLDTTCVVGSCSRDFTCVQTCVCVSPRGDRTCVLDFATPCLVPDDCPDLGGSACRLCYLNSCVTAPAPACF